MLTKREFLAALGFAVSGKAGTVLAESQVPAKGSPTIAGYASNQSVAPGEKVGLCVSTNAPTFSVEIARLGAKREVVWKKAEIQGAEHPTPKNASSHGCHWPVAVEVPITDDWKSGYYDIRFQTTGDKPALGSAFFVVRPAEPGKNAKILLQLSTNTYNAYNNWGGYSLYAYNGRDKVQGRRVSFDRPPSSQFPNWELPFVKWAETNGYAIDFATNLDLELHPEILDKYPLILSIGHDEYWSSPMRDNLEAYIGKGGNVAFLSGNSVCWQVRTEENGHALACWKQDLGDDPYYLNGDRKLLTTIWSHHLVGRPENTLTGVGFLWGGYHISHGQFMDGKGAYTAHRPDHWIFEGTGLERGQDFGSKHTVVGYECDGCEFTLDEDRLPVPTHSDGTPENFQILASCPARWAPDDCEWYERWQKGRIGAAILGTYTRNGTVVTAGSTDWAHGLRGGDAVIERITKNILDKLSKKNG